MVDVYDMARFWDQTTIEPETGVGPWTPHRPWNGGYFTLGRRAWAAPWIPWVVIAGDGVLRVDPTCGGERCVRPDHHDDRLYEADPEAVHDALRTVVACPVGHPFAGGNYAVIDRLTE